MDYVQNIPHTIKQSVSVPVKYKEDGKTKERIEIVEIDISNTEERLKALKQAKDLDDLYKRLLADVQKDAKMKKVNSRRFENPVEVSKINISDKEFPIAAE
jgi:3-methyladenine DNA glycosylase/8-oxoguanine DNA glycosylase